MTTILQCFWISTQIGFASFGNLMSSFAKVLEPSCTVFLGASFIYFLNFSKFGSWFPDFSDPRPNKIGFGACGRFLTFLHVQKIIDLFTILEIFYKFALILFISSSYEPSRQYGTSPFLKTLLKKSK